MFDFPSPATAGQTFSPPGGPQYVYTNGTWRMQGAPYQSSLQDAASDMSIGFKTAGNRFVVNDGPSLNGTDVMQVSETGAVTMNGNATASGFVVSQASAILAATGAGAIYLRPNGFGSSTGQTTIDSAGIVTTGGALRVIAPAATGVAGLTLGVGTITTSINVATNFSHHVFYNTNAAVGSINTNASATAFNTSSDERLKDFLGPYDPLEAIAIIRADPVRKFKWKTDNTDAVGWGAQTSWAISHDLASPPPPDLLTKEPGDEDFQPWGVDQGRRTPYLWAALTNALDRIDILEARIAALEGAP